ncbi:hypothetical protein OIU85_005755 [Salix viminalis]|uniref:Amine oxidase n=1 Tax=Salix viminalis TaxID=40686 RepID=A0A9Q0PJG9_SALVM|nr:hypothetical protein OIU85_005755 [Salix viminalis]
MASVSKNLIFFLLSTLSIFPTHPHPLDPLTPAEFTKVQSIVNNSYPKTKPQRSLSLYLPGHKIVSDEVYGGYGYPVLTFDEQIAANAMPFKYTPFLESIRKRGLKVEEVVCSSFAIGWYGEQRRNRRVVRVLCNYLDGSVNLYMRPIEGITVTVDLEEMKILGFVDRSTVPVPKADGTDYRESSQELPLGSLLKGISIRQSDGPSFTIDGHTIRWDNWDFHLSFDARAGPDYIPGINI